jgi:hypothetical protein
LGWRWPISPRFIPLALDPNITAGRGLKICLSEVLLALKEDAEGWAGRPFSQSQSRYSSRSRSALARKLNRTVTLTLEVVAAAVGIRN